MRYFLPVLLLLAYRPASAESATQTDWSGSGGVQGPVLVWGSGYAICSGITGTSVPGLLRISHVAEKYEITSEWAYLDTSSGDLDGDGDPDLAGAAYQEDIIDWWENLDGVGSEWCRHVLIEGFNYPVTVLVSDLDQDGDQDILGGTSLGRKIIWWENADGVAGEWDTHCISSYYVGCHSIRSVDIDGDGDLDVLTTGSGIDSVTWWENLDGIGEQWAEHTIADDFDNAVSTDPADFDGDGDQDVAAAAVFRDRLAWWENLDGIGSTWMEHPIVDEWDGANWIRAGDLDGDGDPDVTGAAGNADEVAWWENGSSGTTWTQHMIADNYDGTDCAVPVDMDADGDLDVLGSSNLAADVTWWENQGGTGIQWVVHTIDWDFPDPSTVDATDIDGDGITDVYASGYAPSGLAWWDPCPPGYLDSSILDTQSDEPGWDTIDWSAATPPWTSISFLIRASDDPGAMGDWSDTLTTPGPLLGLLEEGDRYVQYRTVLETERPTVTPLLYDITVHWSDLGVGCCHPGEDILLRVAPNPSPSPRILIDTSMPVDAVLSVYDLSGRIVLIREMHLLTPGLHETMLMGLTPGLHVCRLEIGGLAESVRFMVVE